ncbi:MAG: hypothetical protein PF638_10320 [Candidatus Delongbacteria bacterium]|jgi:hypothetical protein|nr:hypothetical protein [Candidatus Delongbacteria bacterium]
MTKIKLKKQTSPLKFIKNTPILPVVSQKDVRELLKLFEEQNLKNTFFAENEEIDKPLNKK